MPVSSYTLILFIHVLAATVLIGSSLFTPLLRRAGQTAVSVAELRRSLELGRRAARGNPLAAFTLLATGIYLGKDAWWAEAWFWVAIGAWLVNSALAAGVVQRTAQTLAIAASRAGDGPVGPEIDRLRRSRSWEHAEAVMRANDIALLYVMLDKPGLLGSLSVLVLASLASLTATLLRERRQRGAAGATGAHLNRPGNETTLPIAPPGSGVAGVGA